MSASSRTANLRVVMVSSFLKDLSDDAGRAVKAEAIDAWGKALSRLGAKKSDLALYYRYLARVPKDNTVVSGCSKGVSNVEKVAPGGGGSRGIRGEARGKGLKLLERSDS